MTIEGLKSTYSIPGLKKERETDANQRRKKNRILKKRKRDEENKKSNGKIDIRI
ncbi:MAG: hypothetical protein JSW20_02705 [Nitrospiraceae bacterium]|nr:MAG: hypothetical protein JSW20_02705 [Nitrospiraceae bacterium]